jgi:hypothetical protein
VAADLDLEHRCAPYVPGFLRLGALLVEGLADATGGPPVVADASGRAA